MSQEGQHVISNPLYQAAVQNVPSIQSVEDSDSNDEEEELIFSGLNNHHDEDATTQNGPAPMHSSSRQTSAKPLYSWQPSSPGAASHSSTSWAILAQSHQGQEAPKVKHQQLNGLHQQKAETATTVDIHTVREDARLSSTAGWFAGAAGQLAASRGSIGSVPQLDDNLGCQPGSGGTETEEEVERAFQHCVQSISNPAPTSASVQLTAAVHDMDIDHLLQKLICGEIEYNPHDPNSGLPPASSLFTDSEASSEAEDDRAAPLSQAQPQGAVLSHNIGQLANASASKAPLQQRDVTGPKSLKLVRAPSSENQGSQQPASEAHQKGRDSQTNSGKRAYIRHRQTSRLATRFQRREDYDSDSLAEEFDEWRISRAELKRKCHG
ncbi:hypothetical protein ABBQ38_001621 [Trebouxia sp. C0009 RCD-2024]